MGIGNIYVIENENGKIKIGKSINPTNRIHDIERIGGFNAISTYITNEMPNYSEFEIFLHRKYKKHRVIGEWFNLNFEETVLYIEKTIKEGGSLNLNPHRNKITPINPEELASYSPEKNSITEVQKTVFRVLLHSEGAEYDQHVKDTFAMYNLPTDIVPNMNNLSYREAVMIIRYWNSKH